MKRSRAIFLCGAGLLAALSGVRGECAAYSAVVVLGDSLSDNGNLYAAVGYPPAPYYQGRFSNGPVAVEQVASTLGVPLYDYAYGGATSGVGNIVDGGTQTTEGAAGLPGMQAEFAYEQATFPSSAYSSSLFIVWGGANDFEAMGSPTVAAANVDAYATQLMQEGAATVLVPGLPNLGLTPEFYGAAYATAYTDAFNEALLAGLPAGAKYVDTESLLNEIVGDPGAYGITNTTASCYDAAAMTVCSDPSQYLFWDDIHPTTTADAILAQEFIASTTPEPSSMALLSTGVVGALGVVRRRRAK